MVKLQLHEGVVGDMHAGATIDDSYEAAAQEGLIAWLKDVGDRFKANLSGSISYKHCEQLIKAIDSAKDFDYSDMEDREVGKPFYTKKQVDDYIAAIGPAASEITSKIMPFFKKAMACSAKDIEAFYNKKDFSKKDTKNAFEKNDREAFELWKKIRDDKNDPIRKLQAYGYDYWFYKHQAVTEDWIRVKDNEGKTYGALGYKSPKDLKPLFQLVLAETIADKCPVFGKMYKSAWALDKITYELLEKKIRGNRYVDLPVGLYNLYMLINAGVFHTVYTSDRAFWVPAMPMNCDHGIAYTVRRLARVLDVELA